MKIHWCLSVVAVAVSARPLPASPYQVVETETKVLIRTPELEAAINKKGYVTGVARQSFLDKKTGFRDAGFGLDIVDWLMEPGSDAAYREQLVPELRYNLTPLYHGHRPKRSIEGPQICTRAGTMAPTIVRGPNFVAIKQQYRYHMAAPGKKAGSVWTQWIVFPVGQRYFLSMDRIDSVNDSDGLFLRIDMPGHIRHRRGDTFSEVYLSYLSLTNDDGGYRNGRIPPEAFFEDFPPDARFNYRRDRGRMPDRFIRAYRLRDPKTGRSGPWLAGMTLEPSVVHEAWCHQRGYVCMIEEFGGRPIRAGQSFSAAFIVGYFDSIEQMHRVYDAHKGYTALEVTSSGWKLTGRHGPRTK